MRPQRACPATEDQDSRVDLGCRAERVPGKGPPGPRVPPPLRPAGGSAPLVDVAAHHSPLKHQIGGDEP
jgi:hypothetical protein